MAGPCMGQGALPPLPNVFWEQGGVLPEEPKLSCFAPAEVFLSLRYQQCHPELGQACSPYVTV